MESKHCGPDVDWTAIAIAHKWEKLRKRKKKSLSGGLLQIAFTGNAAAVAGACERAGGGAEALLIFTSSLRTSASDCESPPLLVESWTAEPSGVDPPSGGCCWELTSDDNTLCGSEAFLQHVAYNYESYTQPPPQQGLVMSRTAFDGTGKPSSLCLYPFINLTWA